MNQPQNIWQNAQLQPPYPQQAQQVQYQYQQPTQNILPHYYQIPYSPISNGDIITDIRQLPELSFSKHIEHPEYTVQGAMSEAVNSWPTTGPILTQSFSRKNPILLTAPTGSGKTQFAIKDVASFAQKLKQRVLIIVNRRILRQQILQMCEENHLHYAMSNFKESEGIVIIDNIIISTYQQFAGNFDKVYERFTQRVGLHNNLIIGKQVLNIGFIIMDEAHYFVADSSFGGNTAEIYRNILRLSYFGLECRAREKFADILGQPRDPLSIYMPMAQRIYMTATPYYVKSIIAREEWGIKAVLEKLHEAYYPQYAQDENTYKEITSKLYKVYLDDVAPFLPTQIEEHVIAEKKRKLNIKFFYHDSTIESAVLNSPKYDKWLIFVDDKQKGVALKKRLGSNICSFIYSDKKHLEERDNIAINRRFDKMVLIATSVLDNGVSIKDRALKNIVIDTTDRVELLQMLGRKRPDDDEWVTLYLKSRERKYFKKYIKSIDTIMQNIDRSWSADVFDFENEIIQKEFVGEKYFSFDRKLLRHTPSPYALYYLSRKRAEHIQMQSDLAIDRNAFHNQLYEWLNPASEEYIVQDKDSEDRAWEKILELIKPYLDGKKISKEETIDIVHEMQLILEDFKYGTGIRTAERTPKASANNILSYFAKEKGTDWYKLRGGNESYTIVLFKKGAKKATEVAKDDGNRNDRYDDNSNNEDNVNFNNEYADDDNDEFDDDDDYDGPRYGDYDYPYDDYQDASDQDE